MTNKGSFGFHYAGERVARITVEDCLEKVPNRFELIHVAAKRVKQLAKGSHPLIETPHNKPAVTALREVAAGYVAPEGHADLDPQKDGAA